MKKENINPPVYSDIPLNKGELKRDPKAFTLVELIIVITIIVILSTISFISYSGALLDSRNAVRVSDMGNIKIALKNHKLKNGTYPIPGDSFDITNFGSGIITEGFLNENVSTQEISKRPKDPLLKSNYYLYSIMKNKLFFQIAMSIEQEKFLKSFVDGDYQQIADAIPSIVLATTTGSDINTLSGKFILDNGTYNLPYDKDGNIFSSNASFSQILSETGVNISKFSGYYSCQEIYENASSMGSGTYMISDVNGQKTSTGCNMIY